MKAQDYVSILQELSNPVSSLRGESTKSLLSNLASSASCDGAQIFERENFMSKSSTGQEPFLLCLEVLSRLDSSQCDLATSLQQVIVSTVRSNGLGPRRLRHFFQLLLDQKGSFSPGSTWLFKLMAQLASSTAPRVRRVFVFDGTAGLYLGGDFQWAWDKGWGLDCDVWVDPTLLSSGQDMLLLRMIGGEEVPGREGIAFEVLLSSQGIAIATGQGAARAERRIAANLPRSSLAHITMSYTHHQIKTSEVEVWVDGQRTVASLKYPSPQVRRRLPPAAGDAGAAKIL
jgi:hypothetical protein